MSREGYESYSQSNSLPYPEDFDSLPDHRSFRPAPSASGYHSHDRDHDEDAYRTRPRASSNLRHAEYQSSPIPPAPPVKPIYDAVNNAFDHSSAANALPHDLIAQITEQVRSQVIDSLRAEGVGTSQQQSQPQQTHQDRHQPLGQVPLAYGAASHLTGPTSEPPHLGGFHPYGTTSTASAPPRHDHTPLSDKRSSLGSDFADVDFSFVNGKLAKTKLPSNADGLSRATTDESFTEVEKPSEGPKIDLTGRYGDRTGDDTLHVRPPPAARARTDEEETVVEKMWQPLFDNSGRPTLRLSQFLRGIALYLIDEVEPKKSLVVTPAKMLSFYHATRLEKELYDWEAIFSRTPPTDLSKIYRELRARHHFVQDLTMHDAHIATDTPSIPALTTEGFATWMTLMILADPRGEFDRLSHAVKDMPISNADDCKERFPKELSRRLLPKSGSPQARAHMEAVLGTAGQVSQARPGSHTSQPPLTANRAHKMSNVPAERKIETRQDTSHTMPVLERQRNPYSRPPGSDASSHDARHVKDSAAGARGSFSATVEDGSDQDDDDDGDSHDQGGHEPSIQIERERKPYTAKEGAGKVHERERAPFPSSYTESPMDMHKDFRDSKGGRGEHPDSIHRSASVAVDGREPSQPSNRPHDINRSHRDSVHDGRSSHRKRSPTYNPQVRSDSSVHDVPEHYYTTRSTDLEQESIRDREGGYRHQDDRYDRERDRDRRYPDEQYQNRYDDGAYHSSRHGSSVDPYGQPPLGSGARRYG